MAILILAGFGWSTFQQVRLEGPRDRLRQNAHDTVADALPPPLYIVESYLTVFLIDSSETVTQREALIAHLRELEAEFNVRVEYWRANQPFPELREVIIGDVESAGNAFYLKANADYIPAVQRGDTKTAETLLNGELRQLYDKQRAAVDVLIDRSEQRVKTTDAETTDYVGSRTTILIVGFIAILLLTIALAYAIARSIVGSVQRLRKAAIEDLPAVITDLRTRELEPGTRPTIAPVELGTKDELADAADAFNSVLQTAVDLASEQAELRHRTSEIFVNLGRRNQNLVSRQLKFIDTLEERETDPELLASLFRLDHLATRMRRNAESLLVLAGVEPPRRRREPVAIEDVLRSAAAEVEDFKRIQIRDTSSVALAGEVLSPVSHMLAELMENAARFSPPDTDIVVSAEYASDELVISVADQGMGMPPADIEVANRRLSVSYGIEEVPTAHLGLFVVARLAASLGIHVSLDSPTGEGLVALVRIPAELVVVSPSESKPTAATKAKAKAVEPRVAEVRAPIERRATAPVAKRESAPVEPTPDTIPTEWVDEPAPELEPVAAAEPAAVAETATVEVAATGFTRRQSKQAPSDAAETATEPEVASTGFVRRQSKQANAAPVTSAVASGALDRSADDVRNRMDRFALGKRKGEEERKSEDSDAN